LHYKQDRVNRTSKLETLFIVGLKNNPGIKHDSVINFILAIKTFVCFKKLTNKNKMRRISKRTSSKFHSYLVHFYVQYINIRKYVNFQ
jgi:hypothetical protein